MLNRARDPDSEIQPGSDSLPSLTDLSLTGEPTNVDDLPRSTNDAVKKFCKLLQQHEVLLLLEPVAP
jgi:hypothetical protein